MLSRLFRRDRRGEAIASSLYGAIVAQARRPALYAGLGVPDSVAGRFEMVLLHTILVTRRLALAGEAGRAAGQGVFDLFCRDMDHSLREMGVGDLSVPKKMRKVGEAYFGRAAAYEPGLAAGDVSRNDLSASAVDALSRSSESSVATTAPRASVSSCCVLCTKRR